MPPAAKAPTAKGRWAMPVPPSEMVRFLGLANFCAGRSMHRRARSEAVCRRTTANETCKILHGRCLLLHWRRGIITIVQAQHSSYAASTCPTFQTTPQVAGVTVRIGCPETPRLVATTAAAGSTLHRLPGCPSNRDHNRLPSCHGTVDDPLPVSRGAPPQTS